MLQSSVALTLQVPLKVIPDFPMILLRAWTEIHPIRSHTTLVSFTHRMKSHGILTMCPSGAAFAIPLGPTNPWLITIAKETLIFRVRGSHPHCGYLCQHSYFATLQHGSPFAFIADKNTLLPRDLRKQSHPQFRYYVLTPIIFGASLSMSELLRYLSRMAASKPTSSLSEKLHHLKCT